MPELGDPISERELDVLNCLAEGDSNREIAEKLSISHNTVKVHVRNIFSKLGVSSRTEATTVALQKGVLSIPGIDVDEADEEAGEGGNGEAPQEAERGERILDSVPDAGRSSFSSADDSGSAVEEVPTTQPEEIGRQPPARLPLYIIGLIAVSALLLAGLAAGGFLNGGATAEPTPPVVETEASPPADLFPETEIGENWFSSRPLPRPRARMALATVGLDLYVIGGETASGIDSSVTIFETQGRRWRAGASKLTAIADAAADVLAGEIYVVGGYGDNGRATAVVEAYSPLNDGWRPVTPLPQAVAGATVLTTNGRLYVFGGEDRSSVLDEAFVYEPATQEWRELPSLQQARTFAVGGVLGGKVYVVGGSDGQKALASCELFDPLSETWDMCPEMQEARAAAGASVLLNKLYVLGGGLDDQVTSGELYDGNSNSWSRIETPMLADSPGWPHLGVASVETHIYALGGMLQGELSDELYVYRPLVYQFFIPAASAGREG